MMRGRGWWVEAIWVGAEHFLPLPTPALVLSPILVTPIPLISLIPLVALITLVPLITLIALSLIAKVYRYGYYRAL